MLRIGCECSVRYIGARASAEAELLLQVSLDRSMARNRIGRRWGPIIA